MATAGHIHLSTELEPVYHRGSITSEQTRKASELLQENHDKFHIFFNDAGFHDHIAHHLITIWSMNAPEKALQDAFDTNKSYQRSLIRREGEVVMDLNTPEAFESALGNRRRYRDFLIFFSAEIEKTGWQEVVQKYVFAGDARADGMLVRMFAGLVHPFIHLGLAVETAQPALVAEALAQAACCQLDIGKILLPAEKAAKAKRSQPSKTAVQLLDAIHEDQKIHNAVSYADAPAFESAIISRAGDRLAELLGQYHVRPEDLEEQTAASINAVIHFTAGVQRPGKLPMFDFSSIHAANSSLFMSAFLRQNWLSDENKVRLLEWKVRYDLKVYASLGSPKIQWEVVKGYKPRHPEMGWEGIEDRACRLSDDGHTAKLIRALANGRQVCEKFQQKDEFRVKQDDWLQIAHMVMDTSEFALTDGAVTAHWVRGCGFDEAWENIPKLSHL